MTSKSCKVDTRCDAVWTQLHLRLFHLEFELRAPIHCPIPTPAQHRQLYRSLQSSRANDSTKWCKCPTPTPADLALVLTLEHHI